MNVLTARRDTACSAPNDICRPDLVAQPEQHQRFQSGRFGTKPYPGALHGPVISPVEVKRTLEGLPTLGALAYLQRPEPEVMT